MPAWSDCKHCKLHLSTLLGGDNATNCGKILTALQSSLPSIAIPTTQHVFAGPGCTKDTVVFRTQYKELQKGGLTWASLDFCFALVRIFWVPCSPCWSHSFKKSMQQGWRIYSALSIWQATGCPHFWHQEVPWKDATKLIRKYLEEKEGGSPGVGCLHWALSLRFGESLPTAHVSAGFHYPAKFSTVFM